MNKSGALWKWLLLLVLAVWSVGLSWPLGEKVPLGIDISGGFRFLMEVEYDKMQLEEGQAEPSELDKKQAREQALTVLRNRIDNSGTREPNLYLETGTGRIVFEIPGVGEEVRDALRQELQRPAYLEFRLVHKENDELVRELLATGDAPPGYNLVQVEGRSFYQEAKDDTTGQKLVGFTSDEKANRIAAFHRISAAYELMLSKEDVNGQILYSPYFVKVKPEMDGRWVSSAASVPDQYGRPSVSLSMKGEGQNRFFEVTKNYCADGEKNPGPGRQLGIVMDNTLFSAPSLNEPIGGGSASITGSFTWTEASTLAAALRSGALPAPVQIVSEQKIEPTLGAHSVAQGVNAAMVGAGVVVVFMLLYYRVAGLVVNLALILDVLLLPLCMFLAAGFLGTFSSGGGAGAANINALPTLTLPGIAALVLTIGMAVDANVLIFERIREEQRAGKSFATAIQSGYEKVFSTIFDANVTTMLVAIILYMQGSGPIRGFAVMLAAGILVSMFTALVYTRLMFDFLAATTSITKLKMLSILPHGLNIDFLGKKKFALAVSALVLAGTVANLGMKGKDSLGVDFTGGSAIVFGFNQGDDAPEKPGEDQLREVLEASGLKGAMIQYQTVLAGGENLSAESTLLVKVGFEEVDAAQEAVIAAFGESHGFSSLSTESISGQVGKDMRNKGILAIVFAMIGIVIYISFRFEFAFAMGCIAALLHDVLITVGLYCLFGRQLSLPIVAALLTIVGYSVNDTIVVFDRIREDLKLLKGRPYEVVANTSINQTLSRTLLTSLTTLMTVSVLLIMGGGAINDFALALFIGVIVGTYSSTFIATPVMLLWHRGEKVSAT